MGGSECVVDRKFKRRPALVAIGQFSFAYGAERGLFLLVWGIFCRWYDTMHKPYRVRPIKYTI